MHKEQEEILRIRIHNLEKVIARQKKLLKRVDCYFLDLEEDTFSKGFPCCISPSFVFDLRKELESDFC